MNLHQMKQEMTSCRSSRLKRVCESPGERGFVFSALAIIVVIILVLTITYMHNTVSLNITQAGDNYSESQSYLSALSGIEYSLQKMGGGLESIPGTYSFLSSSVEIALSYTDRNGNPLPAGRTRIISASGHSDTKRFLEVLIMVATEQDVWPDTSLIEVIPGEKPCENGEDNGDHPCISVTFSSNNLCIYVETTCHEISNVVLQFEDCDEYKFDGLSGYTGTFCGTGSNQGKRIVGAWIKSGSNHSGDGPGYGEYFENINFTGGGTFEIDEDVRLNGMIYIGGDVEVDEDATMGDPPYDPAHILVPSGKTVEGDFDQYFSWAQHPYGAAYLPVFNHPEYDSLLAIAQAITSTEGNKYKGDLTLNGGTFDLSTYEDNTFFIKGKLYVKGAHITGGSLFAPGILVVTKEISVKKRGSTQSSVDDNIIFISNKKITIRDHSQFGIDYSAQNPEEWPATVNEIFSNYKVEVKDNAQVWAQVYSIKKVKIEHQGTVFGVVYTVEGLEFKGSSPILRGMLFAKRVIDPDDGFEHGSIIMTPHYPLHHFSGINYQVVPGTLREI